MRGEARESNARLGSAFVKHLGEVPTSNLDAIRAVCLALLRPHVIGYGSDQRSDTSMLVAGGLRYVLDDWKPRTEGRGSKVKVGLECDRRTLDERFWAWFNEAKTPEQVLGRTLMVLAAIHYADGREALAKERLYGLGEDGSGSLPGHPDVAQHLERLFDRHAPASRRRRRRRRGGEVTGKRGAAATVAEEPAAPSATEASEEAAIELTGDEREVLLALTADDAAGWYGNAEADVLRRVAAATTLSTQRLAHQVMQSLRDHGLVAGAKVAPIVTDGGRELATALRRPAA